MRVLLFLLIFAHMKRLLYICQLVLLVAATLWGCTSVSGVGGKLSTAYALVNEHPDSTLRILEGIDRSALSVVEHAQYALFYSIAQDKVGLDVDNDSLMRVAYNYYSHLPEDTLYGKCCYYMGLYYNTQDSTKQAIDCYKEAIASSDKLGDWYTQYLAYNRLSNCLEIFEPEEGLEYAKKALDCYMQSVRPNLQNQVYLTLQIGDCFRYLNKIDSAACYFRKANDLALTTGNQDLISDTYHYVSQEYISLSQPDSALYYAKLSVSETAKKDPSRYTNLARCYMDVDSLEQAEALLLEACRMNGSDYTKYNAYNRLLKIGIKRNKIGQLQAYADSAQAMLKRIYLSSENDNVSYRKENENLDEQKKAVVLDLQNTKIWSAGVIFLLLLLMAVFHYAYWMHRNASRRELKYQQEKAQLLAAQEEQRHEQELLLAEAEFRKQKELEDFKHKSEIERQKLMLENSHKQLSVMRKYVIFKADFEHKYEQIRSMNRTDDLTGDDWVEIEVFLDETHSGFMESFRKSHPDLKEADYRLCMLLKLDLNNQELKRFYGIEQESVKHKLLVLKNKLGISALPVSARDYVKNRV